MKFGVWYGMAIWFPILKGLDVAPFAEWSWWVVLALLAWPSLDEIAAFLVRLGRRFGVFVRALGKRKLADAAVSLDAARKQP